MALQGADFSSGSQIPQPDRPIVTPRGQELVSWRKADRVNGIWMSQAEPYFGRQRQLFCFNYRGLTTKPLPTGKSQPDQEQPEGPLANQGIPPPEPGPRYPHRANSPAENAKSKPRRAGEPPYPCASSRGSPRPTQDTLSVAGQTPPGGIGYTHRVLSPKATIGRTRSGESRLWRITLSQAAGQAGQTECQNASPVNCSSFVRRSAL